MRKVWLGITAAVAAVLLCGSAYAQDLCGGVSYNPYSRGGLCTAGSLQIPESVAQCAGYCGGALNPGAEPAAGLPRSGPADPAGVPAGAPAGAAAAPNAPGTYDLVPNGSGGYNALPHVTLPGLGTIGETSDVSPGEIGVSVESSAASPGQYVVNADGTATFQAAAGSGWTPPANYPFAPVPAGSQTTATADGGSVSVTSDGAGTVTAVSKDAAGSLQQWLTVSPDGTIEGEYVAPSYIQSQEAAGKTVPVVTSAAGLPSGAVGQMSVAAQVTPAAAPLSSYITAAYGATAIGGAAISSPGQEYSSQTVTLTPTVTHAATWPVASTSSGNSGGGSGSGGLPVSGGGGSGTGGGAAAFPAIGTLYTPKYPNGWADVLSHNKARFSQVPGVGTLLGLKDWGAALNGSTVPPALTFSVPSAGLNAPLQSVTIPIPGQYWAYMKWGLEVMTALTSVGVLVRR